MRAFSTLIGVIFLLAFLSIATLGMSMLSNSELKTQYFASNADIAQQYSESCVEEVLRRFKNDIYYGGGAIPLGGSMSCSCTVSDIDADSKEIVATVVNNNFEITTTVEIDVIIDGEAINFVITSWEES